MCHSATICPGSKVVKRGRQGVLAVFLAAGCVPDFPGPTPGGAVDAAGTSSADATGGSAKDAENEGADTSPDGLDEGDTSSTGTLATTASAESRGQPQTGPVDADGETSGMLDASTSTSSTTGETTTTSEAEGSSEDTAVDPTGPVPLPACAGTIVTETFDGTRLVTSRWNSWTTETTSFVVEGGVLRFSVSAASGMGEAGIETHDPSVDIASGFAQLELAPGATLAAGTRLSFKLSIPDDACEDNLWIEDGRANWRDASDVIEDSVRWVRWRGEAGVLHLEGSEDGLTWSDLLARSMTPACDLDGVKLHLYLGSGEDPAEDSTLDIASLTYCQRPE